MNVTHRSGDVYANVTFPESTAVVPSCPSEAEDDESELNSVTELQISDDEMSADGDVAAADKDAEERQERIRSEVKP